jgi:hypothetical protein
MIKPKISDSRQLVKAKAKAARGKSAEEAPRA